MSRDLSIGAPSPSAIPRLLRPQCAAWYLGISKGTLDKWVQDRRLSPPRKIGEVVFFDRNKLDAEIDSLTEHDDPWDE